MSSTLFLDFGEAIVAWESDGRWFWVLGALMATLETGMWMGFEGRFFFLSFSSYRWVDLREYVADSSFSSAGRYSSPRPASLGFLWAGADFAGFFYG